MPNGIDWTKDEFAKYAAPINKIDSILIDFARKYNTKVRSSSYHGYLSREISFLTKSKSNNFGLRKSIYLILKEKKWPPLYYLLLVVSNSYGRKELLRIVPVFRGICDSWKRLRWEKTLYEFKENIDEDKLKQMMQEARLILDNFDEINLNEEEKKTHQKDSYN